MSTKRWMGKKSMASIYNGTLFSHKKEWCSDIGSITDGLWKHYAKWKEPVAQEQIMYGFTHMK